jgi:hypothetical protein
VHAPLRPRIIMDLPLKTSVNAPHQFEIYILNINILLLFLHLCTFKTPSLSAFMSDKGNCYHALEKCEGVMYLSFLYINVRIGWINKTKNFSSFWIRKPILDIYKCPFLIFSLKNPKTQIL